MTVQVQSGGAHMGQAALPKASNRVLDPMDRISEILFGLIRVLTYTSTLGVVTGNAVPVREMLIAALGCNLAWGIIDAGLYLLARLNEQGRSLITFHAVRAAPDAAAARRVIADALPPALASTLTAEHFEMLHRAMRDMPDQPHRPRLTRDDWLGALGVCLLVFLCTFPVAIPFVFLDDVQLALRASNAIAIVMLFLCGYAFGYYSRMRPWTMGLAMVAFGVVLVGVAIALGG